MLCRNHSSAASGEHSRLLNIYSRLAAIDARLSVLHLSEDDTPDSRDSNHRAPQDPYRIAGSRQRCPFAVAIPARTGHAHPAASPPAAAPLSRKMRSTCVSDTDSDAPERGLFRSAAQQRAAPPR
jgi:hypothetical protein